MGGTASPFIWVTGYDPLLEALTSTVQAPSPTYVDDSMCLVRGPRQVFATELFLIAVSRCTGLYLETYRCAWLEILVEAECARRALAAFPVEISDVGGGWTRPHHGVYRGAGGWDAAG